MKKAQAQTGRILSVIVALFVMITALFALPVRVNAEGELTATTDPRESVMQIALGYAWDDGTFTDIQWGTCFLINDEYVLTNKHVITMTASDFAIVKEALGLGEDVQANDSHFQLRLYVNKDMTVKATMHDSVNSDDMDFAAVKLAQKIYDRKPIALGDSDAAAVKDEVYAMGFPSDSISNKEYNTKDDVSTVGGTISKVTTTGNVDIIEHTAQLNNGNSGGPLLDSNNNVIGINDFVVDSKSYSIQINAIKAGLDTFGIPYIQGSSATAAVTEEPAEETTETATEETATEEEQEVIMPAEPTVSPMMEQLQAAVSGAGSNYNADDYSEDSYEELLGAVSAGQSVIAKGADASDTEIAAAIDAINDAEMNLEEKSGVNILLIVGIIAIVVIILIIVLVLVSSSKKKKAAAQKQQRRPMGGPTGAPMGGATGAPMNNAPGGYVPNQPPMGGNEGSGETTLLNEGSGETTLLGGGSSAYLVRRKTGENIRLNRQSFKIGKEKSRVDYCVTGNPTVSRLHCEIVKRGADYFVIDQGSANCTYVNGIQISPNKETLLTNMSTLKLSDEEFEFHA